MTMFNFTILLTAVLLLSTSAAPIPRADPLSTDVLLKNAQAAKNLNSNFATLKATDACDDGETSCIGGQIAECVKGTWEIQECPPDLTCFAVPSVSAEGTNLFCTTQSSLISTFESIDRLATAPAPDETTVTGDSDVSATSTTTASTAESTDTNGETVAEPESTDDDLEECAEDETDENDQEGEGDEEDEDNDDDSNCTEDEPNPDDTTNSPESDSQTTDDPSTSASTQTNTDSPVGTVTVTVFPSSTATLPPTTTTITADFSSLLASLQQAGATIVANGDEITILPTDSGDNGQPAADPSSVPIKLTPASESIALAAPTTTDIPYSY